MTRPWKHSATNSDAPASRADSAATGSPTAPHGRAKKACRFRRSRRSRTPAIVDQKTARFCCWATLSPEKPLASGELLLYELASLRRLLDDRATPLGVGEEAAAANFMRLAPLLGGQRFAAEEIDPSTETTGGFFRSAPLLTCSESLNPLEARPASVRRDGRRMVGAEARDEVCHRTSKTRLPNDDIGILAALVNQQQRSLHGSLPCCWPLLPLR